MTFDAGPDDGEDDHDEGYHGAGLRLRTRARWIGPALILGTLLPYEVIDGHPQFLWHLAGELSPGGLIAYLAPALAGLVTLMASFLIKTRGVLAVTILGALVGAALLIKFGADANAWALLPLPESLSQRTGAAVLTLALVAAGVNLTFAPRTRKVGHGLLVTALASATVFYLWPQAGESSLQAVIRLMSSLGDLPNWQFKMGFIVLAVLALWPALVALVGAIHLRKPPSDDNPMIGIVALYGLPLLLTMLVVRGVLGGADTWLLMMAEGGILVLGAVVALTATALEVAVDAGFAPAEEGHSVAKPRRAAVIATGVCVVLAGAQWWMARPPAKGVEWTLAAASPEADTLFDEVIPRWNGARLSWDRQARDASGAQALLAVKRAAGEMVDAANALDPRLGAALKAMASESRDLNIAGRRWYRMVGEVNEAIRASGLPYYLDPVVYMFQREGRRRHFRMRSYRVIKVNRYEADGDAFATLHVQRIDGQRGGSRLLGFSRDVQPFAIVATHESDDFDETLRAGAAELPPTCAEPDSLMAAGGLYRCGQVLAKLIEAHPEGLSAQVTALTDRHELQHQIDGPLMPMASVVQRRLRGASDKFKARVNRELSAYTAEFTAPEVNPRLGLIHILPFALNGEGQAIYHVALMALGQMAGMDLYSDDGRAADRQAVGHAFDLLVALNDGDLRARAADAWRSFYGSALPSVKRLD